MKYQLKVNEQAVTVIHGQAHHVLPLEVALALCELLPPMRAKIEVALRLCLEADIARREARLAELRAQHEALRTPPAAT